MYTPFVPVHYGVECPILFIPDQLNLVTVVLLQLPAVQKEDISPNNNNNNNNISRLIIGVAAITIALLLKLYTHIHPRASLLSAVHSTLCKIVREH